MRRYCRWILAATLSLGSSAAQEPVQEHNCPKISVYFSPRGGCTDAVIRELDAARHTVYMQAYAFTSDRISVAMGNAVDRGVKVEACVDEDANKNPDRSKADEIAARGALVMLDGVHAIAHSKVWIIDRKVVITGSFNPSQSGETSNLENLLVIESCELAQQYLENFEKHKSHSRVLKTTPFKRKKADG